MYPRRIKSKRSLIIAATAVLAAVCAATLGAGPAPAQSPIQKLNAVQSKLDRNRSKQGVLTSTISRYDDRINGLRRQVADLRNREAAVQAELDAVQAKLDVAVHQLTVLRAQLERAVVVLSQRLVDIYKHGEPDIATVILESNGFDDLVQRSDYLQRIQGVDSAVVGRVRDLRNQTRTTVDQIRSARSAVAAKKAVIEKTRSQLQSRTSQLAAARNEQRKVLGAIRDRSKKLEGDLTAISDQIAKQLGAGSALAAGPIRGGGHGLIWPVNGPISSGFGPRTINGRSDFHPGVDIAVPTGTPIRAAASGTVAIASPQGGYGNYTCLDHGGGLSTCYGHQEKFLVVVGQHVSQGQVIGLSDNTGYSFGPHLHFEVRINGQPTNPLNYL